MASFVSCVQCSLSESRSVCSFCSQNGCLYSRIVCVMLVGQTMGSIVILTFYASLAWCDCFWPETNHKLGGMQIRARLKLLQKMAKKRAWEMLEHKVVCQTEYVAIKWTFYPVSQNSGV